MKVKMTRTERAIRKAQKAAKVAYKLGKAPTFYEFTNPVDLMTKEEKFQWELEKYFEDIKGTLYYDEVMSTCEWLLNDEKWCYDHDEYLKKARAVRGPVVEPCDPYEWDDEYVDLTLF